MFVAEAEPKLDTAEAEKEPIPNLGVTSDGRVDGPIKLLRNVNELFDTGEEGEISFVRSILRCLGHSAIGTELDSLPEDEDLPPVNPWKLIATMAKVSVSKERRKTMMRKIGEDMAIGDGLGLLAVLSIYSLAKKSGLPKDSAKTKAWDFYSKLG